MLDVVHRLIERQANQRGDAIALAGHGTTCSYRELNGRANVFARRLLERGLRRGHRIGIDASFSPERLVAELAVLKIGGIVVTGEHDVAQASHVIDTMPLRDVPFVSSPNLPVLVRGCEAACLLPDVKGALTRTVSHSELTRLAHDPLISSWATHAELTPCAYWRPLMMGATLVTEERLPRAA